MPGRGAGMARLGSGDWGRGSWEELAARRGISTTVEVEGRSAMGARRCRPWIRWIPVPFLLFSSSDYKKKKIPRVLLSGSMRTRNADAPKSGATKKMLPPKKDASATAAADKTPEAMPKSTPKSGARSAKGTAKQFAAKATASSSPVPVPTTPDAKPEPKVEEVATPTDGKKLALPVKSPEKKTSGKAKSLLAGRAAAAAPKVEEAVEEPAPPKAMDATEEPLPRA